MGNCTYIDGVAASQALDTAGESIDMNGLDCSSLIGAAFNWEHFKDQPSQIVGKVLDYKKIFSEDDCENERHTFYWNKCQIPFLYVMGRLFDDKKPSAVEVAALFQDDAEHPDEQDMLGFSIEGAKLDKVGQTITRSIARKVTITNIPANKTCVAEMVPAQQSQPKDDLGSIFKTEPKVEIELFKFENTKLEEFLSKKETNMKKDGSTSPAGLLAPMNNSELKKSPVPGSKFSPSESKAPQATASGKPKFAPLTAGSTEVGHHIGTTSGNIKVHSHAKVADYGNIGSKAHNEIAEFHRQASTKAPNAKMKDFHNQKMKLHAQASTTSKLKEDRFANERKAKTEKALAHARKEMGKPAISKALDAGSALAAPGQLVGGAALGKEDLDGKLKKAKVDEGKSPNQKAWARSARNDRHSTDTTTWTKQPGAIGRALGTKPKQETQVHEHSHMAAGDSNFRMGRQATPGHGSKTSPTSEGSVTSTRKVVGTPRRSMKKSTWLARAEQDYANWEKREEFEQFMAKRLPHLSKGEIKAIGQTIALNKSLNMEKAMSRLNPAYQEESKSQSNIKKFDDATMAPIANSEKDKK